MSESGKSGWDIEATTKQGREQGWHTLDHKTLAAHAALMDDAIHGLREKLKAQPPEPVSGEGERCDCLREIVKPGGYVEILHDDDCPIYGKEAGE